MLVAGSDGGDFDAAWAWTAESAEERVRSATAAAAVRSVLDMRTSLPGGPPSRPLRRASIYAEEPGECSGRRQRHPHDVAGPRGEASHQDERSETGGHERRQPR